MLDTIKKGMTYRSFIVLFAIIMSPVLVSISGSSSSDAIHLLDIKSLSTILFFLLISRGFIVSGLSTRIAHFILAKVGSNGFWALLFYLISTMVLSMLVTNDGAVLVMIPVGLKLSEVTGFDPVFTVILGLLAANMGSILFPFSNPQNIIIWQYYSVPFTDFIRVSFIAFGIASLVLILITYSEPRKVSIKEVTDYPRIKISGRTGYTTLGLLLLSIALSGVGYSAYAFLLAIVFS